MQAVCGRYTQREQQSKQFAILAIHINPELNPKLSPCPPFTRIVNPKLESILEALLSYCYPHYHIHPHPHPHPEEALLSGVHAHAHKRCKACRVRGLRPKKASKTACYAHAQNHTPEGHVHNHIPEGHVHNHTP